MRFEAVRTHVVGGFHLRFDVQESLKAAVGNIDVIPYFLSLCFFV